MANRKRREVKSSTVDYKKVAIAIFVAVLIILMINYMNPSSADAPTIAENAEQDPVQSAISEETESKPDTIVQKVKIPKNIRLPQVEILNGCGVSNITGGFASFFKANKLDVIDTGNYSDFQQKTSFIIYHSESVEKIANDIAKKLSVSDVRADIKKIPTHELTLVLGADYGQLSQRVH